MITLEITGGLCNQLYEFLNVYFLARKYEQKLVLLINLKKRTVLAEYLLDLLQIPDVEKVKYFILGQQDKEKYDELKKKSKLLCWINEKEAGDYDINYCHSYVDVERYLNKTDDFWISGFWVGDEHILSENIQEISSFMKPRFFSGLYEEFMTTVKQETAVGVHIRRGDFLHVSWAQKLSGEYYRAGIEWYKQNLENPQFFIFTNDLAWVKQELGCDSSYHYITNIGGIENDIIEFLCLSYCGHKILSNSSTFSLLAHALCDYKGKSRILYKKEAEDLVKEQIITNESIFLWKHGKKELAFNLCDEKIEKLSTSYFVDGEVYGLQKSEIDELVKRDFNSKLEAIDWIKICEQLSFNAYEASCEILSQLNEKKFFALCMVEAYEKATLLAYKIRYDKLEDKAFIEAYIHALIKNQQYEEAMLELARCNCLLPDINEASLPNIISYKKDFYLGEGEKYRFLVCPSEKGDSYDIGRISIELGLAFKRIGHEVVFMFHEQGFYPHRVGDIAFVQAGDEYINQEGHGIACKCKQFLYDGKLSSIKLIDTKEVPLTSIVCTFVSMKDCISIDCEKILFWYSESMREEKEIAQKWLLNQGDKISKKVCFVNCGKTYFENLIPGRRELKNLYYLDSFVYDLVYLLQKAMN